MGFINIQKNDLNPPSKKAKKPSKNWGGRREGAGAKKKEKRHRFNSYISDSKATIWGNGDPKEGVRIVKKLVQKELDSLPNP